MPDKSKKLIVVCGPTAVGKTRYSIELAGRLAGEIVSADSRQIYREMDIATAKPTQEERKVIPHHLMDFLWPDESFSLALYQKMAVDKIRDIFKRGMQPILVGGTGLYISSIIDGYNIPQVEANMKLRERLNLFSVGELYVELQKIDPEIAATINPQNKVRLIRAIEVFEVTGKKISELQSKKAFTFDLEIIQLDLPREELYKRIEQRIDEMLVSGVLDEVEFLGKKYGWKIPSMSSLGYQQFGKFIRGEINLSEAIDLFKRDTRRYAKRQLTWFNNKINNPKTLLDNSR